MACRSQSVRLTARFDTEGDAGLLRDLSKYRARARGARLRELATIGLEAITAGTPVPPPGRVAAPPTPSALPDRKDPLADMATQIFGAADVADASDERQ